MGCLTNPFGKASNRSVSYTKSNLIKAIQRQNSPKSASFTMTKSCTSDLYSMIQRWTRLSRTTCGGTPQGCVPMITVFCCWILTMTDGTPFSFDSPQWVGWKTRRSPTVVGVSIQVGILFGNAVVESMKTIGQWKSQFRSASSALNKAM